MERDPTLDEKHQEVDQLNILNIPRRHSLPTLSLPRLGSTSPVKQAHFIMDNKKKEEKMVEKEERVDSVDQEGEESSNCSTPTMMEPRTIARVTITLIINHECVFCQSMNLILIIFGIHCNS